MRVQTKKKSYDYTPLLWVVAICAIGGLVVVSILTRPAPAELRTTATTDEYVMPLRIAESPSCDQDHFTLTGVSAKQQRIEIVATDTRLEQPTTTTSELSPSELFALPSPLVAESSTQHYKVYSLTSERHLIAEVTTQPRCGGDEE